MAEAKKKVKISFFQKDSITCPVCGGFFKREVLRSGRGRLIAGDLMTDLRRSYKPSPKFGIINPLIYNLLVCPSCLYTTIPDDFNKLKPDAIEALKKTTNNRKKYSEMAFGYFDFNEERTLFAGAISFFLAISCYSHMGKDVAPTTKKGMMAMRASWLCKDLHAEKPDENYDKLYEYFRYVAYECYQKSIETSTTGEEDFAGIKFLGPDTDTNFNYEGVLYLSCYLGNEQSLYWKDELKFERFKKYRTVMAKVFGFGKSSKSKPGPLLDSARELHEEISEFILANRDKYETDDRSKFFK